MGVSPGRGGDRSLAIGTVIGVAAAVLLAVLLNVIGARHFRRWDATSEGLYTLSDATRETLRGLEEPIVVLVLLADGDPLRASIDQMLLAYRAESSRLEVRTIDPDRAPAELLAVQQRYGVVAGRSEDGRLVTDAAIIVARADVPYFIAESDLVAPDDDDPTRSRPRLEEALTSAIRRVLAETRPRVCFTEGHGERSIDVGGDDGLALLRDRLVKNNLEVVSVWGEAGSPAAPLEGCALAVVAGPTQAIPPAHVDHLRRFVEAGGNALFVIGPVPRDDADGFVDLGDAPLFALAGVRREDDFVFELDDARRVARGFGETFLPVVLEHPATVGLAGRGDVVVTVASSLTDLGAGGPAPQRLLETSPRAFAMRDFFAWAKEPGEPEPKPGDARGPLAIAVAVERPAAPGAARGARVVAIATTSVLAQANWQQPELAATSGFVHGVVAWLASHRAFLDIPQKPAVATHIELTEEGLATLFRGVVLFLPGLAALGGVLVWLARRREPVRSTPARPERSPRP